MSDKIDDGGPAFPSDYPRDQYDCGGGISWSGTMGVSVRDYFAAKVLQAYFSNSDHVTSLYNIAKKGKTDFRSLVAEYAYEMADIMLAQRQKETSDVPAL